MYVIDPKTIQLRCPPNVYQQGQMLFNANKVGRFHTNGNHLSVTVFDDKEYQVDIEIVDNQVIKHQCSCKESKTTIGFCKHVVAALLNLNRAANNNNKSTFLGLKTKI